MLQKNVIDLDERGRKLLERVDFAGDGSVDSIYSYSYLDDGSGYRTVKDFDRDADGTAEERYVEMFSVDGRFLGWEKDEPFDGIVDARETRFFDADGKPLRAELDKPADGLVDEVTTYSYPDGVLEARTIDQQTGELVESLTINVDAAADTITWLRIDYRTDPATKNRSSYWTVDGVRMSESDSNDDGVPELRFASTYDENRRLVQRDTWRRDFDGTPQEREIFSYTGDELAQVELDKGIDGAIDEREVRTKTENQLVVERHQLSCATTTGTGDIAATTALSANGLVDVRR